MEEIPVVEAAEKGFLAVRVRESEKEGLCQ